MRQTKFSLAMVAVAAILAGCGSSTGGDQTVKTKFSAQVTFGDSLSDVGTYAVGGIQQIGGGKFTINGNNTAINPALTGKNWTELMAAQLGLPAPCPAQTGLTGDATVGLSAPIIFKSTCFGYAQGGARVTNPDGTDHAKGFSTVPVAVQIQNHLAIVGGKFKGDELVLVMAGGNDALRALDDLKNGATDAGLAAGAAAGAQAFAANFVGLLAARTSNAQAAAPVIGLAMQTEAARVGHTDDSVVGAAVGAAVKFSGDLTFASQAVYGPMVITAKAAATVAGNTAGAKAGADYAAAHGADAVAAMSVAGDDMVALVKTQLLAKGASFVVVNNMPDLATTPNGLAQAASSQALINVMVKAFNDKLTAGLGAETKVLIVDVFAASHDQATNPGPYGLTNVTTPACDLTSPKNPLKNSLGCTAASLIAGDVSHYSFADTVHPTPFTYWLLARYVSEKMVVKGWL